MLTDDQLSYFDTFGFLRLKQLFTPWETAEDIGEADNLASRMPDRLAKMAGMLTQELKARDAQPSLDKETGEPISWPGEALYSPIPSPSPNG